MPQYQRREVQDWLNLFEQQKQSGLCFWFPKAMGFKLDEKTGKAAFWCWQIGFLLAFMPLYVLGFWV